MNFRVLLIIIVLNLFQFNCNYTQNKTSKIKSNSIENVDSTNRINNNYTNNKKGGDILTNYLNPNNTLNEELFLDNSGKFIRNSQFLTEPATAFAIAKFAYSTYEFINKREYDPQFKIILDYLNQINTKLDIIQDQLDQIYDEIKLLPNKIEYNNNISTINGVLEDLKPEFLTLEELINKYGNNRGKRKFLTAEHISTLTNHLTLLRLSFQKIKTYYDPIATPYISAISKMDLKLSLLLGYDIESIKSRMSNYLDYFENATLEKQVLKVRYDINQWRKYESLLNRDENINVEGLPHVNCSCVYFFELTPSIKEKSEFAEDEQIVINALLDKNLLFTSDLRIKQNYTRANIGPAGGFIRAHLQRPNFIELIQQGYLRPGEDGLISHGFSRYPGNNTFASVYDKKRNTVNKEYLNHFMKLVSYVSALNVTNETIIFLNKTIDEM